MSALLFAAFTFAILLVMDLNRPRSGFVKPEQTPLLWLLEDMSQDGLVPSPALSKNMASS
jgi:hypothetical protein